MTTRRQLQKTPRGKHRPHFVRMGGLETWLRNVPYGTKRQFYQFVSTLNHKTKTVTIDGGFAP